jgi:hypothetical protein
VTVFGPFYPPALQAVVNHAERLAELLGVHELAPPTQEWAEAWTIGRADEVVRFVEEVVARWREGRVPDEHAAAALEDYLAALHEGLAKHLGCTAPSCCAGGEATTARPGRRVRRRQATGTTAEHDDRTALGTIDSVLLELLLRPPSE